MTIVHRDARDYDPHTCFRLHPLSPLPCGKSLILLFAIDQCRWPPQQIRRLGPHSARQPVHDVDAGGVKTSLQRTDVGAVDIGAMSRFLLGQAFGLPLLSQIEREHVSNIHGRESTALSSISPRSILYKTIARLRRPNGDRRLSGRNIVRKPVTNRKYALGRVHSCCVFAVVPS
jgi:hypothetical protein